MEERLVPSSRNLVPLRLIVIAVLFSTSCANSTIAGNGRVLEEPFLLLSAVTEHKVTLNHQMEKRKLIDDDNSVNNDDKVYAHIDSPPLGWIPARITEIMESWPLQIVITTESKEFVVELAIDAMIESSTGTLSPGDLSPGDHVDILIENDSARPGAYRAVHIKSR